MTKMKNHEGEVVGEALYRAVMSKGGGRDPLRIVLTALATVQLTLGATYLTQALVASLAVDPQRLDALRGIWEQECEAMPYLRGKINALIDWIDNPGQTDDEALAACFAVLKDYSGSTLMEANDGDLLGEVYMTLLPRSTQQARGVVYTPMHVAFLMANLNSVQMHQDIGDPCCGSGRMAIATIREMRARGGRAETLGFVLNDIDPIAVALAGINMATYGMHRVQLTCGDALANPFGESALTEISAPPEGAETPKRRRKAS